MFQNVPQPIKNDLVFFYPRPADSIRYHVGLSVGRSTIFLSQIPQLWDLIETWGFHVDDPCDFPDVPISPHKKITHCEKSPF